MADVKVQGGHKSSQGLVCIWQGMTFPKWLRLMAMRPPMDLRHSPKIALTTLVTLFNSAAGFFENLAYGRRIRAHQVKPPVFILGHWRSGTTLLHNLLSMDPQFTTTTLYHTLGFHHFLLTESLIARITSPFLPKSRPMDQMEISWDAPQEDEAIICNLCLRSPYLMTAFHSNDSVYWRYFDLRDVTEAEKKQWQQAVRYMLQKISFVEDKRPLLKSPTHTFRVKALLELYPDAKFIHIVRNPYAVFPSAVHMRKQIFSENGLCTPDFSMIDHDFFKTYDAMFNCLEEDIRLLAPNQYHEVKYEDFEQNIPGELKSIYDHLEMPGWSDLEVALQPKLQGLKEYKKNNFSKLDEDLKRRIYEGCRRTFDKYGYERE